MKNEHLYLIKNSELLKELQYDVVKGDDKFLMVEVRVDVKKSLIKIDRFNFDNYFPIERGSLLSRLAWKVIPKIRGLRRKLGLVYGVSRRKLKLNGTSLQGLLSVLDPKGEEYEEKIMLAEIFLGLQYHYTWSRSETQLGSGTGTLHWHIVNYLYATGNKEKAKEISDVWMKSKLRKADRKKMDKALLKGTIAVVDKVEYCTTKEMAEKVIEKRKGK